MNRDCRSADLFRLFPSYLRAQFRIVLNLHPDRSCDFREQIVCLLFSLTQKWIEKSGVTHIRKL